MSLLASSVRPVLYSYSDIYNYFYERFPRNNKTKIQQFFQDTEELVGFKKLLSHLETQTSETDFKIRVVYTPVVYEIQKEIFNHISEFETLKKDTRKYPENFIENKMQLIKGSITHSAAHTFTRAQRQGEIFINNRKIADFSVRDAFHGFSPIVITLMNGSHMTYSYQTSASYTISVLLESYLK